MLSLRRGVRKFQICEYEIIFIEQLYFFLISKFNPA